MGHSRQVLYIDRGHQTTNQALLLEMICGNATMRPVILFNSILAQRALSLIDKLIATERCKIDEG